MSEKTSVLNIKASRRPKKGEVCVNEKLIVLCTGAGHVTIGYKCFSGVVILADENFDFCFYSRTWDCQAFKKLDCKISFSF